MHVRHSSAQRLFAVSVILTVIFVILNTYDARCTSGCVDSTKNFQLTECY